MVAHDGSRRIHLVGAFSAKSVTSVEVRSPSAMRYPTRALARSPSYPSRSEWCCSPLPTQDQRRGEPPSTACTSTIRLLISYLAVITLKGEESRCHGTRVLTWSGRAVPNVCVTDTAQSASSSKRRATFSKKNGLAKPILHLKSRAQKGQLPFWQARYPNRPRPSWKGRSSVGLISQIPGLLAGPYLPLPPMRCGQY